MWWNISRQPWSVISSHSGSVCAHIATHSLICGSQWHGYDWPCRNKPRSVSVCAHTFPAEPSRCVSGGGTLVLRCLCRPLKITTPFLVNAWLLCWVAVYTKGLVSCTCSSCQTVGWMSASGEYAWVYVCLLWCIYETGIYLYSVYVYIYITTMH